MIKFHKNEFVYLQSIAYGQKFTYSCKMQITNIRPESDHPYRCKTKDGNVSFFKESDLRICLDSSF